MEDIKIVKKITNLNTARVRTKGRPKERWRCFKGTKTENLEQIVKVIKVWNDLMQKTKTYVGLKCQEKKRPWLERKT